MITFKCKMCGGDLTFEPGASVAECPYCGTNQTLPKLDDDKRANLYDRANHFRRQNEFDKAMAIYEQVLAEDRTDAEAYWSLVLCRYGIEYVEDPASHKRVPTVNRVQYASILADEDYKSALAHADAAQRRVYEAEANAIAEIQKGILDISRKEAPFDVFICYKETDANGRRTPDSVLANDMYHQLTKEGFKVFFSRITLEDKIGTAYEPYIFAALNSAKVMVVLGTKPEYFNAVWVKNEWSRYLALIRNGADKTLVPAYRDMDPYDLPEEFAHLQAQDMGKLGFMQDLIRGIKKILHKDEPKPQTVAQPTAAAPANNVAPLLKRAFMFLEDGDFARADDFCEQVLNLDPENAHAYLGKLMAELNVQREDDLKNLTDPFDDNFNYKKALRFADNALRAELTTCNNAIITRIENERREEEERQKKAKQVEEYVQEMERAYEQNVIQYNNSKKKQNEIHEAKQEVLNTERQLDQLARSKKEIEDKIAHLHGIFSVKKRKELTTQLDLTGQQIDGLSQKLSREKSIASQELPVMIDLPDEREHHYKIAILYLGCGEYKKAYHKLVNLKDYKDVDDLLSQNAGIQEIICKREERMKPFKKVGNCVIFGKYPQSNNETKKTDVEWLVLDVNNNRSLLISRYALDSRQFNEVKTDSPWHSSSLRRWLNNRFFKEAFDEIEQKAIALSFVDNGSRQWPSSSKSAREQIDTKDKVFLLSYSEAKRYFSNDFARRCGITEYGIMSGAKIFKNDFTVDGKPACIWLLRSPAYDNYTCGFVGCEGALDTKEHNGYGAEVNTEGLAIRPAIWIDLEALEY